MRSLGEKCDHCYSRDAVLRVLDSRGYEIDFVCLTCAPKYIPTFEDADGNEWKP